ncbi:MAG: hypothetical protein ACR2NU_07715, partial [Aeoliella sp.]
MTAILFFCLAVLALVGHGYFWVGIVNRLHGLAGPRKLIDGGTLVCLFAFLALPFLLLCNWQDVLTHWSAGWNETAGPAARYFQFCSVWCLGEFLLKAAFSKERNNSNTLSEWKREPVAATAQLDASMFHGAYPQLLARVPGNQILQLCVDHKQIAIPRLHEKHDGLTIAHV